MSDAGHSVMHGVEQAAAEKAQPARCYARWATYPKGDRLQSLLGLRVRLPGPVWVSRGWSLDFYSVINTRKMKEKRKGTKTAGKDFIVNSRSLNFFTNSPAVSAASQHHLQSPIEEADAAGRKPSPQHDRCRPTNINLPGKPKGLHVHRRNGPGHSVLTPPQERGSSCQVAQSDAREGAGLRSGFTG